MTPQQKVVLVESVKDTYGLNVALTTVGLPKSTWYYHKKHKVDYEEKHAYLLPVLDEIARKHPEYGVPRIMPELREAYDNGKRGRAGRGYYTRVEGPFVILDQLNKLVGECWFCDERETQAGNRLYDRLRQLKRQANKEAAAVVNLFTTLGKLA